MSNCTDIDSVKWTEPGNLVSLAVLAFINVLVIVGNCLVIAAVFCSHKLRSVTNFFIVSLAVADLLVGLAVLPFSATWEVFKVGAFAWFLHFVVPSNFRSCKQLSRDDSQSMKCMKIWARVIISATSIYCKLDPRWVSFRIEHHLGHEE